MHRIMLEEKYIGVYPFNNKAYLQNAAFDLQKNKGVEALVFVELKKYLKERNVVINTYDIPTKKTPEKYVYLDMPYPSDIAAWKIILANKGKNILLCNETPLVIPFNYWKILHIFFSKIYTWHDGLIDSKKYFRIHWPKSSAGINTKAKSFKAKKFLVIINTNKLPFYPFKIISPFGKELYTERIKSIEFFENKIPEKFYFYGKGWNKRKKYNIRELFFGYKKYGTYRGTVDDKIKTLSDFKYALCFENVEAKGYITEKIFDAFKAKCVPIYWGAPDITTYIPKNCFIDFRDFYDYEKLLNYITNISEDKYNGYIKNIEKLLSNKKFRDTWFEEGFARFFFATILEAGTYEKNQ